MTSPSQSPVANHSQVGSLIYALTTPPERTSKLSPRWKGPYWVCRVPNDYQVVYEDGDVERTIQINHAKLAKFTAPDLPEPVPPPETPRPPLGYLPAGLAQPRPPAAAAPDEDPAPPSAPANQQPAPAALAENAMPPPAPAATNQQPEPAPRPWRSPRINPELGQACAIKGPPENPPHHTSKTSRMAHTYPLTVSYNECLGSRANPLSFANLHIVDLRNGQSQYLSIIKQLVDALPKTEDPSSRFALQEHIARRGQAFDAPLGRSSGGCCRQMGSSAAHPTPSSTS